MTDKTKTHRLLHSIPETASQLGGLGRTTIYELAKRGDIKLVKIGARSFVTDDSLSNYVSRLMPASGAADSTLDGDDA